MKERTELLEIIGEMYATSGDVIFDSQRCIDTVDAFESAVAQRMRERILGLMSEIFVLQYSEIDRRQINHLAEQIRQLPLTEPEGK